VTVAAVAAAAAPVVTFWNGAIVVGAGPSGMATAACLQLKGVPCLILEKSDGIASLWKHNTYDRLHLHIPKEFCELPHLPFPADFPTYPNRRQFIQYLDNYAAHFKLDFRFNQQVTSAAFDPAAACWKITTRSCNTSSAAGAGLAAAAAAGAVVSEFRARWLVVASGENAEAVCPVIPGAGDFKGRVLHSSRYKSGADYQGLRVLVVGAGNSGMEIALDLTNFNVTPSLVVRGPVHILPREVFGKSTFAVAMKLLKTFPLWFTDSFLVWYAWALMGDTNSYGLHRPAEGPMTIKTKLGKTPVLDVGTFAKIKNGDIKVVPAIDHLTSNGAQFADGQVQQFDAIILATGYRSNVPQWLNDNCNFFSEDGFPRNPSPKAWKGETGLYIAGLGRKGILGAAFDAKNIADDISQLFFAAELESHARVQPAPQQQQQQLLRKPQMLQVPSFQPNAPTTQPPQLHTPMN
jgi:indole-3-pyruvate monooxygenase